MIHKSFERFSLKSAFVIMKISLFAAAAFASISTWEKEGLSSVVSSVITKFINTKKTVRNDVNFMFGGTGVKKLTAI